MRDTGARAIGEAEGPLECPEHRSLGSEDVTDRRRPEELLEERMASRSDGRGETLRRVHDFCEGDEDPTTAVRSLVRAAVARNRNRQS